MINLLAASQTDTGRLREENEDCAWAQVYSENNHELVGLFVVCDGMGGHMGGKFASYWAVEAIKREFADLFVTKDPRATLVLTDEDVAKVRAGIFITPKAVEPDIEALTESAIQRANQVVYQYARHRPEKAANAGTTLTMMVTYGTQAIIANAGDSRTYLLRDHELIQISRDHSLVADLVAEGAILPTEIYTHPQRNVIYRYLGQKGIMQADIFHKTLQPGDHVILCSDGLWEMVRKEEKLVELVEKASDPLQACQDLIQAANDAGGEDNISVIVVRVV
jgi:serine/threonine protein phosphatase PrpC